MNTWRLGTFISPGIFVSLDTFVPLRDLLISCEQLSHPQCWLPQSRARCPPGPQAKGLFHSLLQSPHLPRGGSTDPDKFHLRACTLRTPNPRFHSSLEHLICAVNSLGRREAEAPESSVVGNTLDSEVRDLAFKPGLLTNSLHGGVLAS